MDYISLNRLHMPQPIMLVPTDYICHNRLYDDWRQCNVSFKQSETTGNNASQQQQLFLKHRTIVVYFLRDSSSGC